MSPRPFSLCLAYYENAGMLVRQLEALGDLPPDLRGAIRLVVVDDGSPVPATLPDVTPVPVQLYRMGVDVPWNQDACRNLAAQVAESDWLLLTDMDHVPSPELWARLINGALADRYAYSFERVNADRSPYHHHPNSWAMTRKTYERSGGYDERYAGVYGTDGIFASRLGKVVKRLVRLPEPLVRYSREIIPDASTVRYARKSPENDERRRLIGRQIKESGDHEPKKGLFPWTRIR